MDILQIGKFTLIITTRCNLHCKLCCEYVTDYKPFPDITLSEADTILAAAFDTVDFIDTLHLSGGGEPFLHKELPELIRISFKYEKQFRQLMLFTNSTIRISDELMAVLVQYKEKIIIHASDYGVSPEKTNEIHDSLRANGINLRVVTYHGESPYFGGWVDFGAFEAKNRTADELKDIFNNCAITRDMKGNWRTRDGKMHWCSRSQRGLELGLIPDFKDDYLDLLDNTLTREQKRSIIKQISNKEYLQACDWCSGDHGTNDQSKRHKAGVQRV